MFYAIEILRSIESLHAAKIVHGSISPSVIHLRNEISAEETIAQIAWNQNGTQGWDGRGKGHYSLLRLLR